MTWDQFPSAALDRFLTTPPRGHYTEAVEPYIQCRCAHRHDDHNPESGECIKCQVVGRIRPCREFREATTALDDWDGDADFDRSKED